jgi:hypothetical protein
MYAEPAACTRTDAFDELSALGAVEEGYRASGPVPRRTPEATELHQEPVAECLRRHASLRF